MKNTRSIGRHYENIAVSYLENNGYEILEKNYLKDIGEIDIIARQEEVIVAVEVKYRKNARFGIPANAVDKYKQNKISKTFLLYLVENNLYQKYTCRFDVISITNNEILHIENAFESTLDSHF